MPSLSSRIASVFTAIGSDIKSLFANKLATDCGAGQIGSFALMFYSNANTPIVAGTIYSGAKLYYAQFYTAGSSQSVTQGAVVYSIVGASAVGTWRAMHSLIAAPGNFTIFLAQRIA
jgi:hypothetical protein